MEHGLVQIATPDEVTKAEMAEAQGKEQAVKDAFASDLFSRWQGYREARREVEEEWLDGLRAVKGEYGPEQEKVMEEQQALSRVFIKITATKNLGSRKTGVRSFIVHNLYRSLIV